MRRERDLTQGPILPSLLSMAAPTAFGFFAQTAYDLANLYWIGRLSAKAVAGTTIFATMLWIVEILNEIIGMSSVSLISQAYGSGDMDRTRKAVEQTLVFKALVALLAGLCLFAFLRPMARFFSDDPEVISFAVPFAGLTLPGLGLGVSGAAVATVTTVSGAFLFGLYYLSSGRARVKIRLRGLLRLDRELDRKLITVGLPAGAELLTRNIAGIAVLKLVAGYGTAAVAAMGGAAIVGQNLGGEKTGRATATSLLAAAWPA